MSGRDETHDPARRCWVPGAGGHRDFPVQNLPLGIFSTGDAAPRAAAAIGNHLVDLAGIAALLPAAAAGVVGDPTLNRLFALPAGERRALRRRLSELLSDEAHRARVEPHLRAIADCTLHLPAAIGDYTDFYVGIHHAEAVGRLFRPDNPLLPNYKHVPIGYHGRASSVRVSGVPVRRPVGQTKGTETTPVLAPTQRLDYELELGVWIGQGNAPGEPIAIAAAADHVAGFSLLNDWSARDVQAWEYQPLGPFLAKNFATTVSPWVVTAEALAPFRVAQPPRSADDPRPLPYLWDETDQQAGALALMLEVAIQTEAMRATGLPPHRLGRAAATNMYWTIAQIVTHHTVGGCDLRPADLLGTGTISAPAPDGRGSLIEMTRGAAEPVALPSGETRTFLEDDDEVVLTARAEAPGAVPIGFGEARARILPARLL